MPATYQKKARPRDSLITRNEPRSKRSALSSRFTERAAQLWTARRKQIAARRWSACRSRFAALDVVRRRFTASAPDTVMSINSQFWECEGMPARIAEEKPVGKKQSEVYFWRTSRRISLPESS